ncbi:MAG: stringent starvation protein A [Gammaproteobacteria bacterium]|nr:MAG: stringent starvation protein A [Gammaproteobacteria bacterium]
MVTTANRKPVMSIFSSETGIESHRVRIVLAEKKISAEIEFINLDEPPEDFIDLNPYGTLPALVDRDLVLHNSRIIMEYLDERFPHPPLCSVDPVARARFRTIIQRIDDDWYPLVAEIEASSDKKAAKARKLLKERLISVMPVFAAQPYFMSDEFTLVDCVLAPLLWRLPVLGIELPKQADAIKAYSKRLFERESFLESLSEEEKYFNAEDSRLRG